MWRSYIEREIQVFWKGDVMGRNIFTKVKVRYYFELVLPAVLTLIYGYIMWRKVLSPLYLEPIPNCVLLFVLFGSMMLLYSLLCGTIEILLKRIRPDNHLLSWKYMLLYSLIAALIVGVLAGVLEIIYEIQFKGDVLREPDELVYVIDDSGSMYGNDPKNYRLSSVSEINNNLRNGARVGLVRFDDKILFNSSIQELDAKYKNYINGNLNVISGGGTDIDIALKRAVKMYQDEDVGLRGSNSKILLLTDGMSNTPVDESYILSECNKLGVNIDVISLGSKTDSGFIRRITKGSGGHICKVPSDYYINAAYKILIGERVNRCLLVPVILVDNHRVLLGIMQFVFLSLIGMAMHLLVTYMFMYKPYINRQLKHFWKLVFIASLGMVVSDSSFFWIFVMIALFLVPLFDGRVIKKKRQFKKIKLPRLQLFKEKEDTEMVDQGLYLDSGFGVGDGIGVDDGYFL